VAIEVHETKVYAYNVRTQVLNAIVQTVKCPLPTAVHYVLQTKMSYSKGYLRLLQHVASLLSLLCSPQGLVALLGDSAHAMQPNLGQGGCMAIEDGYQLAIDLTDAAQKADGLGKRVDVEQLLVVRSPPPLHHYAACNQNCTQGIDDT